MRRRYRRNLQQREQSPPAQKGDFKDDDSQTSAASEWITTSQDIFASYATMESEVRFAWLRAHLEDIHDTASETDTATDKSHSRGSSPSATEKRTNENMAVKFKSNHHKDRSEEIDSPVRIRDPPSRA